MEGPDDAPRVDHRNRAQCKAGVGIENAKALGNLAVRIKIRQKWMTDAAEALRPNFERGDRIARKTE